VTNVQFTIYLQILIVKLAVNQGFCGVGIGDVEPVGTLLRRSSRRAKKNIAGA